MYVARLARVRVRVRGVAHTRVPRSPSRVDLEHLINAREEDLGKRLRDYRRQQLLRQKTQGAGSSVLDLAS
jgi:hypothetical protein